MVQRAWHLLVATAICAAGMWAVWRDGRPGPIALDLALILLISVVSWAALVRGGNLKSEVEHAEIGYELARDRERVLRQAAAALIAAPDRAAITSITRDAALDLGFGFPGLSAHVDLLDEPSLVSSPGALPPVSGGWMAPDLVLTVPLTSRSTVYGMIVASGDIPLTADICDALETLASQVTLALQTAALTEDLDRQRSETRVTALIQNSSDVVMVLDSELTIRYVTPSVTRVLGHFVGSLLGRRLVDIIHPDDQAKVGTLRSGLETIVGASNRTEWRMRRGDGRWVDVESISNDLLDHPGVSGLVVTTRDISDRKRLEDGLKSQVDKLQELDRIKNDFVATVSHELRTPITSVIGQTEMLLDGDFGVLDPMEAKAVGVIDRNSHRLLLLIEDLLTLNQIESGELHLEPRPTDLTGLLERAVYDVRPAAESRRIQLDLALSDDLGTAIFDSAQIERVVANLLTNAVKFTPEGGRVRTSAERDHDQFVMTVSDTGIGIPEDEQQRLFTRFFRSSVAVNMAIQGTGLGLVIVKRIVEEHGGTISLESAPGRGTTVRVAIPFQPASMPLAV